MVELTAHPAVRRSSPPVPVLGERELAHKRRIIIVHPDRLG